MDHTLKGLSYISFQVVNMSDVSVIAKRLQEARTRVGISQRQLGIKAGIDPFSASPRINQYERGKHTPDYATTMRLAKVLGVPTPYLYAEDDDLAELILRFGKLSKRAKKKVLSSIENSN